MRHAASPAHQPLAQALAPTEGRITDLPDRDLRAVAARLSAWTVTPSGTEGYAKAEVTVGGVDTRDLSSRTMQATAPSTTLSISSAFTPTLPMCGKVKVTICPA